MTAIVADPPAAANFVTPGVTVNEHDVPAWEIVTSVVATLNVPVRAVVELFAAIV